MSVLQPGSFSAVGASRRPSCRRTSEASAVASCGDLLPSSPSSRAAARALEEGSLPQTTAARNRELTRDLPSASLPSTAIPTVSLTAIRAGRRPQRGRPKRPGVNTKLCPQSRERYTSAAASRGCLERFRWPLACRPPWNCRSASRIWQGATRPGTPGSMAQACGLARGSTLNRGRS